MEVFYPDYIDHQSALFNDLSQEKEMVSWGVDLARSASDALSDGFVTSVPYFILILLVFASSWYQQKQIRGRNQQAAISPQQQMIFKIMPFFLPVISFSFDAALVVYFVISNLYRIIQQGYITRKFYGENENKENVVVSVPSEKIQKTEVKQQPQREKNKGKAQTNRNSSTEAKRKRTTAGNNENNSHLDEKKPVKSSKKKKRKENSDTDSTVKNPINTGRITPSGTNVPRSQKKSKKKKRK